MGIRVVVSFLSACDVCLSIDKNVSMETYDGRSPFIWMTLKIHVFCDIFKEQVTGWPYFLFASNYHFLPNVKSVIVDSLFSTTLEYLNWCFKPLTLFLLISNILLSSHKRSSCFCQKLSQTSNRELIIRCWNYSLDSIKCLVGDLWKGVLFFLPHVDVVFSWSKTFNEMPRMVLMEPWRGRIYDNMWF